jgi:hypothetical protein
VGQGVATQGGDEPVAIFNATGTEGFVAIDADSPDDPITFPTPDEVEQPISLDAGVFDNGTWRSTAISFPGLGEEQLGFPVQIRLDAPRLFEGTIDRETGEMTADAALEISVPDANATIPVRANLITGVSGGIQGETEGLDTATVTATVRNSGDVMCVRTVTVSLTGGVVDPVTESVELGPGKETEVSLEWETAEEDAGEYEAAAEVGGQIITERVIVDESVGEADSLVTSTGGYMAYSYDMSVETDGHGLEFPDKNAGEDPIRIWGVIDEEVWTWELVRTEFPTIVQESEGDSRGNRRSPGSG